MKKQNTIGEIFFPNCILFFLEKANKMKIM